MKKFLCFLMAALTAVAFVACSTQNRSESGNNAENSGEKIESSSGSEGWICGDPIYTAPGTAYDIVENDRVILEVRVDTLTLYSFTDPVTVTVKATAKQDTAATLCSGGGTGVTAIKIRLCQTSCEDAYYLFSEDWMKENACNPYDFALKTGESITYEQRYTRYPLQVADMGDPIPDMAEMPQGEYRVSVGFGGDFEDVEMIETDVVVYAGEGEKPSDPCFDIIETEIAVFTVQTDKTRLKGRLDEAAVSLTVTAKKDVMLAAPTTAFGACGALGISCEQTQDGKIYCLYDENSYIGVDCAMYYSELKAGDSLTRTLHFSRWNEETARWKETPPPTGEYRVCVSLAAELNYVEGLKTDIVITATEEKTSATAFVEYELASFSVSVDKTVLQGKTDEVTITVKLTPKKNMTVETLWGVVGIVCYRMDGGVRTDLYDPYWLAMSCIPYEVELKRGESVTHSMRFSRYPTTDLERMEDTSWIQEKPVGKYYVQVWLDGDARFDTGIVIDAR